MDGYVFGVNTACNSCDYNLNPCLRRHLKNALIANQHLAERELGYALTESYHVYQTPWRGCGRYQLPLKGVSAVNVKEKITRLGEDYAISPFVLQNVEVIGGIVTVPASLIDNPESAVFRDVDTLGVVEHEIKVGYPRKSGTDWLISVDVTPFDEPLFVHIQHCQYMKMTISTPDTDGEVVAVYPNTETIIPFAKEPVLSGGNTTYWFYAWSLVDPAFAQDAMIDLLSGEFYKLMSEIGLISVESEEALPLVYWSDGTTSDDEIKITQYFDNILKVDFEENCRIPSCPPKTPIKIAVYYKTDPSLLEVDLDEIAMAIVYLSAAELPDKACDCPAPEYGFIHDAQKPYADVKINQVTGDVYMPLKYGSRHGQRYFWERIAKSKISSKKRSIRL